jgi:hypothetical protein
VITVRSGQAFVTSGAGPFERCLGSHTQKLQPKMSRRSSANRLPDVDDDLTPERSTSTARETRHSRERLQDVYETPRRRSRSPEPRIRSSVIRASRGRHDTESSPQHRSRRNRYNEEAEDADSEITFRRQHPRDLEGADNHHHEDGAKSRYKNRQVPPRSYSSPPTVNSRRNVSSLKLEPYDGQTCLKTYLLKFENYCSYYGLNERDSIAFLKQSLIGHAAEILWDVSRQSSLQQLIEALQTRFGRENQIEHYKQLFRSKRQARDESLESLYLDVLRLSNLAYPGERGKLFEQLVRDAYIQAILDTRIRQKLLEFNPPNVFEAHTYASRMQSILEIETSERRNARELKTLPTPSDDSYKIDNLQKQLNELCKHVNDLAAGYTMNQKTRQEDVKSTKPEYTRSKQNNSRLCYYCNKTGHLIAKCHKKAVDEKLQKLAGQSTDDKSQSLCHVDVTSNDKEIYQYIHAKMLVPSKRRRVGKNQRSESKQELVKILIDTGADSTIFPAEAQKFIIGQMKPTSVKLHSASGQALNVLGSGAVRFDIQGQTFNENVLFSDDVQSYLVGAPWLAKHACVLDLANRRMIIAGHPVELVRDSNAECVRRIVAAEQTVVSPACVTHIKARLKYNCVSSPASDWYCDNQVSPCKLILPRMVVPHESKITLQVCNVSTQPVTLREGQFIANATRTTVQNVPSLDATAVCTVGRLADNDVKNIAARDEVNTRFNLKPPFQRSVVERDVNLHSRRHELVVKSAKLSTIREEDDVTNDHSLIVDDETVDTKYRDVFVQLQKAIASDLELDDRKKVVDVLRRNLEAFAANSLDLGCFKHYVHDIKLKPGCQLPKAQKLIRYSEPVEAKIREEIKQMLQTGVIRESQDTQHGVNLIPVAKYLHGEVLPQVRAAVDLRSSNLVFEEFHYPVDNMERLIHGLARAERIIKCDIASAYNCIPITDEASRLLVIQVPSRKYELTRLPYGYRSAQNVFAFCVQRMIQQVESRFLQVYADDVIIAVQNVAQGIQDLERLLQAVISTGFKLKPSKCQFLVKEAEVCGFIVGQGRISEPQHFTDAVQRIKFPETKKQVRKVLGSFTFYRSLHKNLAGHLQPFYDLLKGQRNGKVQATPDLQQKFQQLKDCMLSRPVLGIFRADLPVEIFCDASDKFCGATLANRYPNGDVIPWSYFSAKFSQAEANYCINRREVLCGIKVLQRHRHLLFGVKNITIFTDSQFFARLMSLKELTPQLARWVQLFCDFGIKIQHVSAQHNLFADLLSRDVEHDEQPRSRIVCSVDKPCTKCQRPESPTAKPRECVVATSDVTTLRGKDVKPEQVDSRSPVLHATNHQNCGPKTQPLVSDPPNQHELKVRSTATGQGKNELRIATYVPSSSRKQPELTSALMINRPQLNANAPPFQPKPRAAISGKISASASANDLCERPTPDISSKPAHGCSSQRAALVTQSAASSSTSLSPHWTLRVVQNLADSKRKRALMLSLHVRSRKTTKNVLADKKSMRQSSHL